MLVLSGCKDAFFSDQPHTSAVSNFEIFWNDFDRYYGQFDIRHINWDSIHDAYRPLLNEHSSDADLYVVLNDIIQVLEDGHVNLYTPIGVASYNALFPVNYFGDKPINPGAYINFSSSNNSAISWGILNSDSIGYINIHTFYSDQFGVEDPRYDLIDPILQELKNVKGIVIDIRSNGGGDSGNAVKIASRFTEKRTLYYKQRYRNGPAKDQYSEWVDFYIEPAGAGSFVKPVVVLTSRFTFSTAEIFTAAMKVSPHVTIVGDTTGGGIGNPVYRELLNGWSFRLSTAVGAQADGSVIDGTGIFPEIPVLTTSDDAQQNRDPMLEKAIEILQ